MSEVRGAVKWGRVGWGGVGLGRVWWGGDWARGGKRPRPQSGCPFDHNPRTHPPQARPPRLPPPRLRCSPVRRRAEVSGARPNECPDRPEDRRDVERPRRGAAVASAADGRAVRVGVLARANVDRKHPSLSVLKRCLQPPGARKPCAAGGAREIARLTRTGWRRCGEGRGVAARAHDWKPLHAECPS